MLDFSDVGLNKWHKTHTHIRLTALCPGLPRWAGTWKVKPIWILLEQETVSGSGTRWAICKSAPRSRQKTTPAPHRSVFYRPDALPAAQPSQSTEGKSDISATKSLSTHKKDTQLYNMQKAIQLYYCRW